jgi:hypothetical protein
MTDHERKLTMRETWAKRIFFLLAEGKDGVFEPEKIFKSEDFFVLRDVLLDVIHYYRNDLRQVRLQQYTKNLTEGLTAK